MAASLAILPLMILEMLCPVHTGLTVSDIITKEQTELQLQCCSGPMITLLCLFLLDYVCEDHQYEYKTSFSINTCLYIEAWHEQKIVAMHMPILQPGKLHSHIDDLHGDSPEQVHLINNI